MATRRLAGGDHAPSRSLDDRFHRANAQPWRERLERQYGTARFPTPPVAESADIRALRTLDELHDEGRLMRHCVASYHAQIMAGRSFVYAVHSPERATLEVSLGDGGPAIGQLKLARNGAPSESTWEAVRRWLRQHDRAAQGRNVR